MIPESLAPIANHLWQSTLFASAAGLLTLALRKNPARVRHWVWVIASLKFLIPFSVLAAIGSRVEWRKAPAIAANVSIAVEQVSDPFTIPGFVPTSATGSAHPNLPPGILLGIWACGFAGISVSWWLRWRRIRRAVRAGLPLKLGLPIRAISSPAFFEPGIFGAFRPVLLLPEGIFDQLTPEQWQSVLAHELCHVRHRDNLIAVVQMFIETAFWFHPLVWWIGKRIAEERERACDEEVLKLGNEPVVYARGILKVCELYLESPLPCAPGVSGANLKRRIETILRNSASRRLSRARKTLLIAVGFTALTGPIAIGLLAQASPQHFEAAMLRLEDPNNKVDYNRPDAPNQTNKFPLNRYTFYHTYLKSLIATAYGVRYQNIEGGPAWLYRQHYDISAKVEGKTLVTQKQMQPMLQNLLKERLHLATHTDHRIVPGYAMVVAKGGSKLKSNTGAPFLGMDSGFEFKFQNAPAEQLAVMIESEVKQPVVDKTGLTGTYDFDLMFTRDDHPTDVPHPDHGTIFTAIQEQLGLKLVAEKVPVDYLVIDHVDRVPVDN